MSEKVDVESSVDEDYMLYSEMMILNNFIRRTKMSKIVSWNLVAYDEDDNEIVVDVHRNHVANVIDDFLFEEFEEEL